MIFFVFSYNRGLFLQNCIDSIEHCAPGTEIVVHDDQSDDPETRAVLDRVARSHTVISSAGLRGHKHGGLYANMQAALDSVAGDRIMCFLQDDVQLVRPLDETDHRFIAACFENQPDLGFLSPAFIRGISLHGKSGGIFFHNTDRQLFFRHDSADSAGIYYSDIFISTSARLRSHGWRFKKGEPANQEQAKKEFTKMGYMDCPFLMWLPYVPAYRGKAKTFALRFAEKTRGCGFYPFRYMTDAAVRRLRSCAGHSLPVAEDFLTNSRDDLKRPWIYDPLQGSRSLKHLSRAEIFIKSLLFPDKT